MHLLKAFENNRVIHLGKCNGWRESHNDVTEYRCYDLISIEFEGSNKSQSIHI